MPRFQRGRTVRTSASRVRVDPGLTVGVHRFRLVVVDASGLRSRPQLLQIRVVSRPGPIRPRPERPVPGRPIQPVGPIRTP